MDDCLKQLGTDSPECTQNRNKTERLRGASRKGAGLLLVREDQPEHVRAAVGTRELVELDAAAGRGAAAGRRAADGPRRDLMIEVQSKLSAEHKCLQSA